MLRVRMLRGEFYSQCLAFCFMLLTIFIISLLPFVNSKGELVVRIKAVMWV